MSDDLEEMAYLARAGRCFLLPGDFVFLALALLISENNQLGTVRRRERTFWLVGFLGLGGLLGLDDIAERHGERVNGGHFRTAVLQSRFGRCCWGKFGPVSMS